MRAAMGELQRAQGFSYFFKARIKRKEESSRVMMIYKRGGSYIRIKNSWSARAYVIKVV